MKRKWKIVLGVLVVLLVAGGVFASVQYRKRGIVTVQTGRVVKQDLTAIVTASGEVKPLNYINLGAQAIGRITDIHVKEGDRVRKSQVLAQLESVQAEAEVQGQRAGISSAQADSAAAEASVRAADEGVTTSQATLDRTKAELERTRLDYERSEKLFNEKLIARSEFDTRRAAYDAQKASIREAETRIAQAKAQRAQIAAQLSASQRRITQLQANLRRVSDALDKMSIIAPRDGVVTNLPVRVGETVVPGIQNSAASTVMTIADMSVITAEVKVDETDIVNVKLNQQAEVSIDAIPGRTFRGHVIEIGNTAILRSTGLAASQSNVSSQEAKDFKVVVALDDPPTEIRPGLSCTAKITTAQRPNSLSVPIQALTMRQKGDLEQKEGEQPAPAAPNPAAEKARREEIQGVFVVSNGKAEFRKVATGITGATDIEVTSGLRDGEEIVTGSFKVLRSLRNGATVTVDNKAPAKAEG